MTTVDWSKFLPMARHIAEKMHRQLRNTGIDLNTLIRVATKGLSKAELNFDPQKSQPQTYATNCINWEINEYLRSLHPEDHRLGRKLKEVENVKDNLRQSLQREPTDTEIATEMKISVEELFELYRKRRRSISLDVKRQDDHEGERLGPIPPSDSLTPEQELIKKELAMKVDECLKKALDSIERKILILRFWMELPDEIIEKITGGMSYSAYGVSNDNLREDATGENVARILALPVSTFFRYEQKAKNKMRICLEKKGLRITELSAT